MDFWKEGPDFLKLPVAEWPKPPTVIEKIKDEASVPEQPVLYEEEVAPYTAQVRAIHDERVQEACIFMSNQSAEIVDEPFNCKELLERCSTLQTCLLYTSPSPRDLSTSRMPSSA